jgi:hypothetical protein
MPWICPAVASAGADVSRWNAVAVTAHCASLAVSVSNAGRTCASPPTRFSFRFEPGQQLPSSVIIDVMDEDSIGCNEQIGSVTIPFTAEHEGPRPAYVRTAACRRVAIGVAC